MFLKINTDLSFINKVWILRDKKVDMAMEIEDWYGKKSRFTSHLKKQDFYWHKFNYKIFSYIHFWLGF